MQPQTTRPKQGKVSVVTGAAQGLGKAFALRLAREGAIVVAVDRQDATGIVAELRSAGAQDAVFQQIDVTLEDQVRRLAATVLERCGRCDILVNNAGAHRHAPFSDIDLAEWRRMMAVNIDSVFLMCSAFVAGMVARGYGRIVNISSDTLNLSIPGCSHYMAAKAAVVGFTRGLANDVGANGVTVNCVAPGLTRTPHTEMISPDGALFDEFMRTQAIKRHCLPEDIVGAVSFLASDDAAFITGQTLVVDGGLTKVV